MPSRTLLDDLSETQAEMQRLSGDPNASEVELISAQAQLATIHDLIAKMAPLGTSAGESTDAAARNVAAAEALAAMTLERDAALAQVDILVKERAKLIEQVTFKAREPGSPMADRPPRVPEGKSPVAMSPMTFLAVLRYDIRRRRGADQEPARRRVERRGPGEAVVAIELGDNFYEMEDGLHVAFLQGHVRAAKRLVEPRDLQPGVILLRVEPPVGERLRDRAPDRGHAHARRLGDLRDAVAGHQEVELGFAPLDAARPPRLPGRALARPFGQRLAGLGHGVSWLSGFCSQYSENSGFPQYR